MKEESNKLVKKIEPKRINLEPDRYFSKAIKGRVLKWKILRKRTIMFI